MNQTEFGLLHGVKRAAVNKWVKRGWVVLCGDEVDVEASNENLKKYRKQVVSKNVSKVSKDTSKDTKFIEIATKDDESPEDAAKRLVSSGGAFATIDEAKRVKESYLALLNQLEYDIKVKRVVLIDDVGRIVGENYAKARTRLLAIPSEEAPRIHRLKTVNEVQDALLEVITDALESLVNEWGDQ